jgi:uncharacterized protein (TIGR00299 family) protein
LNDIHAIIDGLDLPEAVKADAKAVYGRIAEAESKVHGLPVDQIHFHEVGALDAVADVVGVCALMHELAPGRVAVSPVHVGSGQVRCAHGVLPVPAPATALLLQGVPVYGGAIRGELCTPTGAALIRHFANRFGAMPVMRATGTGYGAGGREVAGRANLLRCTIGESANEDFGRDEVWELACNIDDMTGEDMSFAVERMMSAGALDVAMIPATMKKGRPGVVMTVLCREANHDAVLDALFRHTSTIGVREHLCGRYVLARREGAVSLPLPRGKLKELVETFDFDFNNSFKIVLCNSCNSS